MAFIILASAPPIVPPKPGRCERDALTDDELDIYNRLNAVWEDFAELPRILLRDQDDFAFHLNALKDIVAFRPFMRELTGRQTADVVISRYGGDCERRIKRLNP